MSQTLSQTGSYYFFLKKLIFLDILMLEINFKNKNIILLYFKVKKKQFIKQLCYEITEHYLKNTCTHCLRKSHRASFKTPAAALV
jgi:hypothetical protein